MTITVTLKREELDAEAKRARALRAAEILEGAGWVFDEFTSIRTQDLLATGSDTVKREEIFAEIQAAAEIKAHLIQIVQHHQAEQKLNERRTRDDKPADHD